MDEIQPARHAVRALHELAANALLAPLGQHPVAQQIVAERRHIVHANTLPRQINGEVQGVAPEPDSRRQRRARAAGGARPQPNLRHALANSGDTPRHAALRPFTHFTFAFAQPFISCLARPAGPAQYEIIAQGLDLAPRESAPVAKPRSPRVRMAANLNAATH